MSMRLTGGFLVIVLTACRSPPSADGGGTTARPPANEPEPSRPGDPAEPAANDPPAHAAIPGFAPELVALLGIDGPRAPETIDPAATARFAVRGRDENVKTEIAIYDVTGGTMTKTRSVILKDDEYVHSWVWRDQQELVILLHNGELRSFSGTTLAPIKRPPKKKFAAKKPDPGVDRFDRDEGLHATPDGEVILGHCVWGYRGDDDPCVTEISVEVLPPFKSGKTVQNELAPRPPAPGHRYAVGAKVPDMETGELDCISPSGATRVPAPADTFGFSANDVEWLSMEPPIARVTLWYPGLDDASPAPRFFAGCKTTPAEVEHGSVARGPGWYWAQLGLEEASILWQGKLVGSLPRAEDVLFAPP
jgi:hypothetical protein